MAVDWNTLPNSLLSETERHPLVLAARAGADLSPWLTPAAVAQRSVSGDTLLHIAAMYGFRELLVRLLDPAEQPNLRLQVDAVNNHGETPLRAAIAFRRGYECVEPLVAAGADAGAPSGIGDYTLLELVQGYGENGLATPEEAARMERALLSGARPRY